MSRRSASLLSVWLVLRSLLLATYWAIWFLAANLLVMGYEEPTLRRDFGVSYDAYTRQALDLLELTPEQLALERTRGHYAVHDMPHRHWKYYWFD